MLALREEIPTMLLDIGQHVYLSLEADPSRSYKSHAQQSYRCAHPGAAGTGYEQAADYW